MRFKYVWREYKDKKGNNIKIDKSDLPKTRNLTVVDARSRTSAGPMKSKAERGTGKGKGKYGRHAKHKRSLE